MLFLEKIGDCVCSKPGNNRLKWSKARKRIELFKTPTVKALLCLLLATVFCVLIVVCLGAARKVDDQDVSCEHIAFAPTPKKGGIIILHYKKPENVKTWTNKIQAFLKSKKKNKRRVNADNIAFQSTNKRNKIRTRNKSAAASTNIRSAWRPAK